MRNATLRLNFNLLEGGGGGGGRSKRGYSTQYTTLRKDVFRENIFLYLFTELKTFHLSYSIYKHDAIDAGPSSMQDACHINFVIDLTDH